MGRILTAILLLLTASAALADSGALSQAQSFAAGLNPPESDYSVAYLSQIFGTVGNVLQGSSGQILGKMFDIFNKGVMVAAALWLTMTTAQLAIRAAQDGSFMGQNRNVGFTLLRIAMGFALIIPSSTTGYSLLQDMFMKIVVQSAGLADEVWDAGLNYLKFGGKLYIPPSTLSNVKNIVPSAIGSPISTPTPQLPVNSFPQLKPVAQIFQDEVCMIRSNSQTWQQASQLPGTSTLPTQYTAQFHPNLGVVYFPGKGGSGPDNAVCGSVQTIFCSQNQNPNLCESGSSTQTTETLQQEQMVAWQALKQLVTSVQPAAQAYVDYTYPPSGVRSSQSPADFINSNAKIIFNAMLGYGNLITPYQTMMTRQANPSSSHSDGSFSESYDTLNTAEAQGWIMAGAFYWDVEQFNVSLGKIDINRLYPSAQPPVATTINVTSEQQEIINAGDHIVGVMSDPSTPGYGPAVTALWSQYVGAQQNNIVVSQGNTSSQGGGFASAMANSALGSGIMTDFQALNDTHGYNPIVVLMQEGNELLTVVTAMWIGAIVLSVTLAALAGICTSTAPGGLILKASLTWLKSIMMLITSLLLVPGAILAYYVPLYPFLVFTFAAVGWLMMVVEGMAAAPLICLGMTHPEGHDFLGKGEQALMFFLGIFLRPALMVLGLIASMIVSFVAFEMLLSGFGTVLNSLTGGTNSLGTGFLILISMCMMLVIFGMMTMELIEQCYKLTYQLPSYVMKWIGGPTMGEEYGQMAKGLQSATSSGASGAKQTIGGLDKGFGGMVSGISDRKQAKENSPEPTTVQGSTSDGGSNK